MCDQSSVGSVHALASADDANLRRNRSLVHLDIAVVQCNCFSSFSLGFVTFRLVDSDPCESIHIGPDRRHPALSGDIIDSP